MRLHHSVLLHLLNVLDGHTNTLLGDRLLRCMACNNRDVLSRLLMAEVVTSDPKLGQRIALVLEDSFCLVDAATDAHLALEVG